MGQRHRGPRRRAKVTTEGGLNEPSRGINEATAAPSAVARTAKGATHTMGGIMGERKRE